MIRTDDQNSKDIPEKFRMIHIHTDEMYSSKIEQCIIDTNKTDREEMKITQQMKSEETPDSTTDNQRLFFSSKHEATKTEDNCSAKQDIVIPFENNVTGNLLCSSKHDTTKTEDNCSAKQDVVSDSIPFQNNVKGDMYQCKYCAQESNDKDCLITPCRCSGSLRYVHKHCLETWLRVRSKGSSETQLRCELCGYRFCRQKQHMWTCFSCSDLSRSDRWLYYAGIFCLFIIVASVSALVFCFIQNSPFANKHVESKIDNVVASSANTNEINRAIETNNISTQDIIKIVCAVVCIMSIALCVLLVKLCKVPPHKLILGHTNMRWAALPYSASRDSLVMDNVTNL
ncbi:hypothetical protein ACJMK2_042314 [Sinanodonta woodiana]|uniref:RING-type E3 ubiquitin transferase n=1 Tax=Sinanodonta woodiana TaxID=1069815 RepID=A0ABD3W6Y3_SINWO